MTSSLVKSQWKPWGLLVTLLSLFNVSRAQLLWDSPTTRLPTINVYAEFENPVATPGDTVTLILRGFLEEGWHIYSIQNQGDSGPEPTQVTYAHPHYRVVGPLEENPPLLLEDQALGMTLAVHKGEFVFRQMLKLSSEIAAGAQDLQGTLYYQVCDNNICAPLQHHAFVSLLTVEP